MGDGLKKVERKARGGLGTGTLFGIPTKKSVRGVHKTSLQKTEKPFRKGATSQKRDAANLQEAQIEKQERTELLRRVEAEGEIAQRRGSARSKSVGRRSLIRSSPAGLAQTLGG